MAPPKRKREPAGETHSRVEDPYAIECKPCRASDHLRKKAKGQVVRLANCADNPNCLYGLGEHHKGIWQAAALTRRLLGDDPRELKRKPYQTEGSHTPSRRNGSRVNNGSEETETVYLPRGLRNLGATCYLNSMLQCLYMNLPFRKAVYDWEPKQHVSEQQVLQMRALQDIFAAMQLGHKSAYDPQEFAGTLSLNNVMQQDAQEFSKLLLAHLRVIFSQSRDPTHWDLVDRIFQGRLSYVTKCLRCKHKSLRPSTYLEISLNIKGNKTVESCIESYLAAEVLEGENKYFCDICNSKERAERFIELEANQLPPTITLQLMRFVYDANAGRKKKLMDVIEFNETLNMTELLRRAGHSEAFAGTSSDAIYRLSAYSNHRGKSAHVGHYTASVAYPKPGHAGSNSVDWFEFDDTIVHNMSAVVDLEGGSEREGKTIRSRDAYMLLYVRDDSRSQTSTERVVPSTDCVERINAENVVFDAEVEEYQLKAGALEKRIQERTEAYSRFFDKEHPYPEASATDYYWIDTDWLRAWITGEEVSPQTITIDTEDAKEETKVEEKRQPTDNNVDAMTQDGASASEQTHQEKIDSRNTDADIDAIPFSKPMDTTRFCCVHCNYMVGKAKPKRRFSPENVVNLKRISREFFEYLEKTYGIALHPKNSTPVHGHARRARNEVDMVEGGVFSAASYRCELCETEMCNKLLDNADLLKQIDFETELLKAKVDPEDIGCTYLMSRAWIASYKAYLQSQHKLLVQASSTKKAKTSSSDKAKNHFAADENSNMWQSTLLNEDITCYHGNLILEKKKYRTVPGPTWLYLCAKFPCTATYESNTTEPCAQCQVDQVASEECIQVERESRDEILTRGPLNRLYRRKPASAVCLLSDVFPPAGLEAASSKDPQARRQFVIPRDWIAQWREYIRNVDQQAPRELTCAGLMCPHKKLLLPQSVLSLLKGTPVEWHSMGIEFVDKAEMVNLAELYGVPEEWYYYGELTSNGQVVWKRCTSAGLLRYGETSCDSAVELDEEEDVVCHACEESSEKKHLEELQNFENRVIHVQLLNPDQAVPLGETLTVDAQSNASRRRSRRIRSGPSSGANWHIRANAADSIYMLKTKIFAELENVYPAQQTLYYKGVMLEDGQTLKRCGIKAGDAVFMRLSEDIPDELAIGGDDVEREVGFEDSVFLQTRRTLGSIAPQSASAPVESRVWVCSACTFVNEDTDLVCEMCTTEKAIEVE